MSLIQQMRGGRDYDATFGARMRGSGEFAALLEKRFDASRAGGSGSIAAASRRARHVAIPPAAPREATAARADLFA